MQTTQERGVLILYGTQTGTAKDVSEEIGRQITRRGLFQAMIKAMDKFDITHLQDHRLVIFVCSTTGQGEVPDNMKAFWKMLLSKDLPNHLLDGMNYSVFGLGDTGYVRFNFAAKMLYNRIKQLGATPLIRRGDGDDQHRYGLYGDLYNWIDELITKLLELNPLPPGAVLPDPSICYQIKLSAAASSSSEIPSKTCDVVNPEVSYSLNNPFCSKLVSNERITAEDWEQDVRHVVLDTTGSNIRFSPGDVCYIITENPLDDVDKFLSTYFTGGGIEWNPAHQIITDITSSDPNTIPSPGKSLGINFPISLRDLIKCHLDILGTPRKYFFELLSHFAADEREKERLKYFGSKEGAEDAYDYSQKAKRTYIDILKDFPSARPPLHYLLDLIPILNPRPFSIASSQLANPNQIQISMAVIRYKSYINRLKRGVCSNWIANLKPSVKEEDEEVCSDVHTILNMELPDIVPIYVKPGTMSLPADDTVPLIMVGPGTGCAIFRAFIQHRSALARQGKLVGKCAFFFGCRHETKDFLYQDEWKAYQQQGILQVFDVAFSRDTKTTTGATKKVYVQEILVRHSKDIWEMLCAGGYFYISGRANKMPTEVRSSLISAISTEAAMSAEQAETYVKNLERLGRYATETWS